MPNALSRTRLTLLLIVVLSATLPSSIMAQQKIAAADEQPLKPERNSARRHTGQSSLYRFCLAARLQSEGPRGLGETGLHLTARRSPTSMAESP